MTSSRTGQVRPNPILPMLSNRKRNPSVSSTTGPISAARTAARASATSGAVARQAPVAREHPASERDQDERPEAVESKSEPHRMEQEQHAEQNEHDRAHGNFARLDLCAAAKSRRQTKGIRHRLRHLNCLCRAHRINDLVYVKEGNAEAADNAQSFAMSAVAGVSPGDEQNKSRQMRQSLGILPGVNRAYAEGKESGENSSDRRVRSTAASGGGGGGGEGIRPCAAAWGTVPETNPAVPVGTPSVFLAPRQSSQ